METNIWKEILRMKRIRKMISLVLAAVMLFTLLPVFAEETHNGVPEIFDGIRLLQEGDSGEAVKALQTRLLELNYKTSETDGIYGKGTAEAVLQFQMRSGLL